MTIAVEGIWKHGKIIPLENIDVEEDTKVTITITETRKKNKKSLLDLAGVWKDYKTKEGKSIDDVKEEIYETRKISTRKEVAM